MMSLIEDEFFLVKLSESKTKPIKIKAIWRVSLGKVERYIER